MQKTNNELNFLEKTAFFSIVLLLCFLLSTHNFSVGIAALAVVTSTLALLNKRALIKWDSTDKIVVLVFSAYLLSNLPLVFIDWGNFRYLRGGDRLILCIPIYFFFKYLVRVDKFYIKALSIGLLLGSIGALVIAGYQILIEHRPRVDGFLFSINFGYLSCALAILSLSLVAHKQHRKTALAAMLFSITAMLFTLTRGAILALPIIVLFAYLLNYKRLGIKVGLIGLVVIVVLGGALYNVSPKIQKRVDFTIYELTNIAKGHSEQSVSAGGRLSLWVASIEAFKQQPITGMTHSGRENLNKTLAENGIITKWAATVPRGHAHSQYFEMLASGGLFGILASLAMFIVPLCYFTSRSKSSPAAFSGALFVMGFAIFCTTEVALQQNLISTFYGFMLALLFAATQLELKHKDETNNVTEA